jgi:hypothetical protein
MGKAPDLKPRKQRTDNFVGGIPDPILVSERVAVSLFISVGMTRDWLRKRIDASDIMRRKLVIDGREHEGLVYQELVALAQSLPTIPPNE